MTCRRYDRIINCTIKQKDDGTYHIKFFNIGHEEWHNVRHYLQTSLVLLEGTLASLESALAAEPEASERLLDWYRLQVDDILVSYLLATDERQGSAHHSEDNDHED